MTMVVALLGIIIFDKLMNASYDGAVTLIVKQTMPSGELGDDYKYDGYYAVMANQVFADTLESWLDSPEIIAEVYEKAGMDVPVSMSYLANRFEIDKVVSQSVAVRINAGSTEEAQTLLKAMVEVLKSRIENVLVGSQNQPMFTLSSSNILVLPHQLDYRLQFGVGLVGAVVVGLFMAYAVYAMKEE